MEPGDDEMVVLFSDGLLSKCGFCDGEILGDLWDYGFQRTHEILLEVVKRKLIPALNQKVKIEFIGTCHNPVRAVSVDGVDVRHLWHVDDPGIKLTPESVSVHMKEIVEIAVSISSPNKKVNYK